MRMFRHDGWVRAMVQVSAELLDDCIAGVRFTCHMLTLLGFGFGGG